MSEQKDRASREVVDRKLGNPIQRFISPPPSEQLPIAGQRPSAEDVLFQPGVIEIVREILDDLGTPEKDTDTDE